MKRGLFRVSSIASCLGWAAVGGTARGVTGRATWRQVWM